MRFSELDVVKVLKAFEGEGIEKGDIGTIVCVYSSPQEAYEVEFVDDQGRTIALFAVLADDLEEV